MALTDFVFRMKPQAGDATPKDLVTGQNILGTVTADCVVTNADLGGGVRAWRFKGGMISGAMPAAIAALNLTNGSGDAGVTVVVRCRVMADGFGVTNMRMFQLGGTVGDYDGVSITRQSGTAVDMNHQAATASHAVDPKVVRNYVMVIRPNSGGAGEDAIDTWVTTPGRTGTAPNASAPLATRTGGNLNTLSFRQGDNGSGNPATQYENEVHEVVVYRNAKTAAEAAQLADAADLGSIIVADGVGPTMNGAITPGAVTSSSISYSWLAASDNVGVATYERSLDGGTTWLDIGNVLTRTDSGLAASTAFPVRVRGKDAAGNPATTPLAVSMSTTAAGGGAAYTLVCSRMANNTGAGKKVSTTFTGVLVYGGDFNDLAGKTMVAVGSTAVDANGDATITGLPQTGAAMLLRKWADGARSAEFVTVA